MPEEMTKEKGERCIEEKNDCFCGVRVAYRQRVVCRLR